MKDKYIYLPRPYMGQGFGNYVNVVKSDKSGGMVEIMPRVEKIGFNKEVIVYRSQSIGEENKKYFGVIYLKKHGLKFEYDSYNELKKKHPATVDVQIDFVYRSKTYDSETTILKMQ